MWRRLIAFSRKRPQWVDEVGFPKLDEAMVVQEIAPQRRGRVKFNGCIWYAITEQQCFGPNQRVQVLYRQGNTLVVGPLPEPDRKGRIRP
ncbi:hypothetical protein D0962_04135 [Leptolyngbyaceae cyanobacterium CCMR0082]|uniref:NfeD-like C-terminal domain-containing protein n=2 Tax=Adonisia turfae TaxID=2950184 RepID=A0A6M0S0G1_9CYAN|nr:NfeD family protein [Adonisia turfae]NEZ57572.1 hypothetical protein [Adonisia turfae CCMR0081]NEZ61969.1 hypothetical protein [Adonisia turfae CCMR0082]